MRPRGLVARGVQGAAEYDRDGGVQETAEHVHGRGITRADSVIDNSEAQTQHVNLLRTERTARETGAEKVDSDNESSQTDILRTSGSSCQRSGEIQETQVRRGNHNEAVIVECLLDVALTRKNLNFPSLPPTTNSTPPRAPLSAPP